MSVIVWVFIISAIFAAAIVIPPVILSGRVSEQERRKELSSLLDKESKEGEEDAT